MCLSVTFTCHQLKNKKRETEGFAEMKQFVDKTEERENKRSGFTQRQKDGESDGNDKSRG